MRPGSAGVSTEASGASAFTLRTYLRKGIRLRPAGPACRPPAPLSGCRGGQASVGCSGVNFVRWVIQGAL
ncbi:hypothetical protein GCM10010221_34870 [Streptomyces parvus]|nr:hypothetical protein GCM10010221_34870 [Streptomyces parvus]